MSNVDQITKQFGIPDRVQFDPGPGNQPMITLFDDRSVCEIAIYGAHVLCYRPKGREKIFWNSPASYEVPDGKAIRGGIPVCWPWFGKHPTDASMPNHGFARVLPWSLKETGHNGAETWVSLELRDSECTRRYFPHPFKLTYRVSINDSIRVALRTENLSGEPFTITEALHSYLFLSDISAVSLSGLEKVVFRDTTAAAQHGAQDGKITIESEIDRIYENTGHSVTLHDPLWRRDITVSKEGGDSSVIWNPWIDKSKSLGDLPYDAYRQFVCVESANALGNQVVVAPGASHTIATDIVPSHL